MDSCIQWQQGGTTTTPATATVFKVQPTDTSVAPFTMRIEASTFNSTVDYRFGIGYNTKRDDTSEPALYWHIEHNYEDSPGVHKLETYWQWDNGTDSYRPIELLINRSTSQALLQFSTGKTATDTIDFLNFDGSVVIAQFGASAGINIGQSTIDRTDLAQNYSVSSGGNMAFTSSGGYIAFQASSHFYMNASDYVMRDASGSYKLTITPGTNIVLAPSGSSHGIGLSGNLGFYGATPGAQPTITGSRGGNAALANLLTALSGLGLLIDSTTP